MPYRVKSPAKLNLFLHVVGRRADGYHELQTYFQLIDLCDTLTFETLASNAVTLSVETKQNLSNTDNLILKAAHLLQTTTHTSKGCHIHLHKNIPIGGGLGGGSSNAATTLLVLNQIWGLLLPLRDLQHLGLTLGADVPLFVSGKSSFGEGIGEILTPLAIPKQWYLIVHPSASIKSGDIFTHKELTRDTKRIKITDFTLGMGHNDCTRVVARNYPPVQAALLALSKFGQPRLTGTGACVFLAFNTQAEAMSVYDNVAKSMRAFVAEGINESPRAVLRS